MRKEIFWYYFFYFLLNRLKNPLLYLYPSSIPLLLSIISFIIITPSSSLPPLQASGGSTLCTRAGILLAALQIQSLTISCVCADMQTRPIP